MRTWFAGAVVAASLVACTGGTSPEGSWLVTVYYTAVESFHDRSDLTDVAGCLTIDCTQGSDPLGSYPRTFATAVKDEGTGRITEGENAGRYLNWASSEGYWLDDGPRDAQGRSLEPFRSAAADGTLIRLVDCGRGYDYGPPPERPCTTLRGAQWEIRDQFTPGFGGDRHIDLYLGEEDRTGFTESEMFTSFRDATLELTPP